MDEWMDDVGNGWLMMANLCSTSVQKGSCLSCHNSITFEINSAITVVLRHFLFLRYASDPRMKIVVCGAVPNPLRMPLNHFMAKSLHAPSQWDNQNQPSEAVGYCTTAVAGYCSSLLVVFS